jgi:tRNA(fMet)-specific endonuclease VapC
MILLDTDAVSELLRPEPSPLLVRRLDSVPLEAQATSTITVGELAYGAYKAGRADLLATARATISNRRVIGFRSDAAVTYGRIRADLESQGQRLDDPDLRIAAIASTEDLILITGNAKHFSRVEGLRVEDWIRRTQ